ncbi:hypothetical protein PPUJ21368_07940 [Pseudomonas putida]|nr:hypothetical protein PPUJ21368_07940 [Pseudomonas putida]
MGWKATASITAWRSEFTCAGVFAGFYASTNPLPQGYRSIQDLRIPVGAGAPAKKPTLFSGISASTATGY